MIIPIKLLSPNAKVPTRAHADDAGADLYAIEEVYLVGNLNGAHWNGHNQAVVKTGVSVAIPPGWYGRVAPRSGLAVTKGLDVLAGVIDSQFRGEIGVVLINHGAHGTTIKAGDKVAQLIIERCAAPEWQTVDELPRTARSDGGFGSSDRPKAKPASLEGPEFAGIRETLSRGRSAAHRTPEPFNPLDHEQTK